MGSWSLIEFHHGAHAMPRLLIINNIPTPYRTFMYNTLYDVGKHYDFDVTVAFQARRETRRVWKPEDFQMHFPHRFSRGVRGRPNEFFTRSTLNLDLLWTIRTHKYDYITIAPSMSVANWISAVLPTRKAKKLMWIEVNRLALKNDYWPVRMFRRALYRGFDGTVCPGKRAFECVCYIRPAMAKKPVVYLPNLADTGAFTQKVGVYRADREALRAELGVGKDMLMMLGIGIAPCKGWHLALPAIAEVPGDFRLFLLGDDPGRRDLEDIARKLKVEGRVRFLGNVSENGVLRHLAAADWFLHAATWDCSPLACVEAVCAGLPMAVSRQTGNAPEVLEEGLNGLTFDPCDHDEFVTAIREMIALPESQRESFGRESERIAGEKFDPVACARRFFVALSEIQ